MSMSVLVISKGEMNKAIEREWEESWTTAFLYARTEEAKIDYKSM